MPGAGRLLASVPMSNDNRAEPNPRDGLLLVDKPGGWTSHDVIAATRPMAATRRVGHAGTLDPMATGLLLLGINRATRLLTYLMGADKSYTATIRLGQRTDSDDATGNILARPGARDLEGADIEAHLAALRGPIAQVPSAISAVKVGGKRSYARVRAGEEVDLEARDVLVHRFEVFTPTRHQAEDGTAVIDVEAIVECSSGTYVRALARDLGTALGTGGHLRALRRTRLGPFDVRRAADLQQLRRATELGEGLALMPLATAARAAFPARELAEHEAKALSYGQRIDPSGRSGSREAPVAAFAPCGQLVALLCDEDERSRPLLVLTPA